MLVRYIGGLAKAAPASGEYKPVGPGGTLEVPEDMAARLCDQGDWEMAEAAKPKKKAADPVAPQVGD